MKKVLESGMQRKERVHMTQRTADMLRERFPNHIPVKEASKLLGVSPRQLSKLVAENRPPFSSLGANIGIKQRYIRIYTERLIAYLNGELPIV